MANLKHFLCVLVSVLLLAACGKAELTPETIVNSPNGLAIQGFDPVAYHSYGKATQGSVRHQLEYQGIVYRFATASSRTVFEQEPERYLPAYGGYCAYAMSNGDIVDINPRNWSVIDGQLYLNANIFAQGLFAIGTEKKIKNADSHWSALKHNVTNKKE